MGNLQICFGRRRVRRFLRSCTAALLIAVHSPLAAAAAGDADRGQVLYEGCTDCHSLDKNDVGPMHRGVFGRKAGSIADYNYSEGLRKSGIVWDEVTLDKWLTDPQALIPDAKMFYHLEEAKDRADVIAFLKERAR
jgi:cytochrome c